jgi:transcriptional regulator with XRE-family HTH domain
MALAGSRRRDRLPDPPGYDRRVTGGQVIGMIVRRQGVSVSELAGRLGVSDGQVVAWMRGDPPLSVVDSVARACDIELAAVLADLDPDPEGT